MKLASISAFVLATAIYVLAQNAPATSSGQRNFINVEGADVKSKLSAAVKQGSTQRGRFWVGYAFDVRPGIAFDVAFMGWGGGSVMINGSSGNSPFETRNLGVFLLHESARVIRGEVYNMDRARDYDGYPVYWLGRATGQESLTLLRGMIDTASSNQTAERMVDAIGAHDDPGAAQTLRDLISAAKSDRARTSAVSWLGHYPGQSEFLAGVVRDERAHTSVRREAAEAIGDSREPSALTTLQDLYKAVLHREVKRELLESIADERFDAVASAFLIQVIESDPDRELRSSAIEGLAAKTDAASFAALEKAAQNANAGVEVQRAAVEAISERSDSEVLPLLKKIARGHPRRDVRQEALERIGERPEQLPFLTELANSRSESLDVRRAAIEAIARSFVTGRCEATCHSKPTHAGTPNQAPELDTPTPSTHTERVEFASPPARASRPFTLAH